MNGHASPVDTNDGNPAPPKRTHRRLLWSLAVAVPGVAVAASAGFVLLARGHSTRDAPSASHAHPVTSAGSTQRKTPESNGRIVFASLRDGRFHIHVINADGTGEVVLTSGPDQDRAPAWSPDGRWIAFTRQRGSPDSPSQTDVFIMRADGTGLVRLTKLAYTGFGRYGPATFIMNADGTGKVQLTADYSGDPVWSPDGVRILFTVGDLESLKLYVINLDGTGMRRLTEGPWDEATPSWEW